MTQDDCSFYYTKTSLIKSFSLPLRLIKWLKKMSGGMVSKSLQSGFTAWREISWFCRWEWACSLKFVSISSHKGFIICKIFRFSRLRLSYIKLSTPKQNVFMFDSWFFISRVITHKRTMQLRQRTWTYLPILADQCNYQTV